MPRIIPIKELKNTAAISEMAHASAEPIYVTKNGYGDMVVMSVETYEAMQEKINVYRQLAVSELQIQEGKGIDAREALLELKEKYGL